MLTEDGGGGDGRVRIFFGSKILAKRDFLGSIKDGFFWVTKKTPGISLGIVLFISSNQQ